LHEGSHDSKVLSLSLAVANSCHQFSPGFFIIQKGALQHMGELHRSVEALTGEAVAIGGVSFWCEFWWRF